MFTLSKTGALRELLMGRRVVTAAGAAVLSALSFGVGVLAAPALA